MIGTGEVRGCMQSVRKTTMNNEKGINNSVFDAYKNVHESNISMMCFIV